MTFILQELLLWENFNSLGIPQPIRLLDFPSLISSEPWACFEWFLVDDDFLVNEYTDDRAHLVLYKGLIFVTKFITALKQNEAKKTFMMMIFRLDHVMMIWLILGQISA